VSAGPAAAHRPAVRRSPAPRAPRRVSGPARGRAATRPRPANAGAVALPQPASQPLVPRLVDVLTGLPDARWLDRIMRGRAWIAIIALALIGLVFMQVSMLGMNTGIGQKVERSAALERSNSELRASVSALSSPERIQREAAAMGMIQPNAGDVTYLRSRGADVDARGAAKAMTAPSPEAAAAAAAAAGTGAAAPDSAATTGALPPTDAALQAQQEEQQAAGTVPGGATDPSAQAQAQPQQQPTAQTQQAPQPQATAQQQPQTQATPQQQAAPQASAQTQTPQPQAQATGAAVAPTTGTGQ
jgi:cell division protein FtsL